MEQHEYEAYAELRARCAALERDLAESRKATESIQRAAEDERLKYLAELNRRGNALAEQMMRQIDMTTRHRREAAVNVLALKALKALRDLVMEGKVSNTQHGWPGEVFRALEDADDLLTRYGIPF